MLKVLRMVEVVHTKEQAAAFMNKMRQLTFQDHLSAGVSAKLFQETLVFAH